MNTFVLLLAALPGVLISYAIFRADKFEREPAGALFLCFALGAVVTVPVVAVERSVLAALGTPPYHLAQTLLLSFGLLAVAEEGAKFAVLRMAAFPRRFFNEPFDGIVYAVLIAMGFATLENIAYAGRFGLQTAVVRALTAVPAHLAFAIAQGYYAGIAKFDPANQGRLLARGFVLSVLLHGAYDVLILQNWSRWLVALGTAALYMTLYFFSRLAQDQRDHSPFREPENDSTPDA